MTKKAPYKGLGADSEEKHEPVSDIDTAAVDSLKVLDPKWPIREADINWRLSHVGFPVGRNDNALAVEQVCVQFVELCRQMRLLSIASLAILASKF